MNLAERLIALEKKYSPDIPGTFLARVIGQGNSQWCLGLGELTKFKQWFYAPTIEEAIIQAEKAGIK